MSNGSYDFQQIEQKWRDHWHQNDVFRTLNPGDVGFDTDKPKCYILDMFPYPSGSGLHVGHPKGYIATDIYSRFKRMTGHNVLHPMGFDSFGLPAEQYAIENNIHPAIVTEDNIDIIRGQLQYLGLSYDWKREIATSRQDFYRWTQWMFQKFFESWFDFQQQKARPIDELVQLFESGQYQIEGHDWKNLSAAEKSEILNEHRIAYQKEVTVNWCPGLGTVLSNEEVTNDGKSERGNFPVFQRPLKQWMMRITAYADRLLSDLDCDDLADGSGGHFQIDWPDPIKLMQKNWIGRSDGASVLFDILDPDTGESRGTLDVFTTRPDTLFGVTFMAVAPEHYIVSEDSGRYLVPSNHIKAVRKYISEAKLGASTAATVSPSTEAEKTGVKTGIYARNPVNGEKIPIFVADYVSMDYGSGAIMAVPAHDERDYAFAKKYDLPVIIVVEEPNGAGGDLCFTGNGISVNSGDLGTNPFAITGLPTSEAKSKIISALTESFQGQAFTNYKLRDWIFSRQRYWGEPFPIASNSSGETVSVNPPVLLPEMDDFRPATSDDPDLPVQPPLARAEDSWREVELNGKIYERELNVMPQWAGSCWYFLRFIDPTNDEMFCEKSAEQFFMPVDLYVGGAEHAVLHLLYSRFWHKVLFDLGEVSTPEPFKKLFNQGMVTADAFTDSRGVYIDIREVNFKHDIPYHKETGEQLERFSGKMGKRYKNGLPPEEIGREYGVDTLRLYEMYMGPLEASAPWSMEGIRGMQRYLQRVWRNFVSIDGNANVGATMTSDLERLMHQTIIKVTGDLENLRFNTAIATLIELNNRLVQLSFIPEEIARTYLLLLTPFAPHLAEELWQICRFGPDLASTQDFPIGDEEKAIENEITLPVQIMGKMRGTISVSPDATEEQVQSVAQSEPKIAKYLEGKKIRKVIVVPKRIINFIVS